MQLILTCSQSVSLDFVSTNSFNSKIVLKYFLFLFLKKNDFIYFLSCYLLSFYYFSIFVVFFAIVLINYKITMRNQKDKRI
jgi:hypothetical protein